MKFVLRLALAAALCASAPVARAESQGSDYKGITDPFGDPSNYEFSDDEKEDKEFFHLGRFIMVGIDFGVGIFTGGLGKTTEPGLYIGAKVLYFFDRSLCFEAAFHYSNHLDQIRPNGSQGANVDTSLIPITAGFRYYFDTKNAPKAIAIANPYLAAGGGMYMRNQTVIETAGGFNPTSGSTNAFGGYAGGGVEFSIYRRHIYLGLDLRYHLVFFPDEDSTLGGAVSAGDRAGDYFTSAATITYNF